MGGEVQKDLWSTYAMFYPKTGDIKKLLQAPELKSYLYYHWVLQDLRM